MSWKKAILDLSAECRGITFVIKGKTAPYKGQIFFLFFQRLVGVIFILLL